MVKNRQIQWIGSFLLMLTMFFIGARAAFANEIGFNIKANIPENQIDKQLSYFDLKLVPNKSQDITVTLTNTTNSEKKINVVPNRASTNQNGAIDYSLENQPKDDSLVVDFDELISDKQLITLKPNESRVVTFTIKAPKEPFVGTVLGGLFVAEEPSKEEKTKIDQDKALQITNTFSYVIGVKLRSEVRDIKPDFFLHSVKPELKNHRTALVANLQNNQPTIVKDMIIDGKVVLESTNEEILSYQKESLSMAPNSNFDLPISYQNTPLKPGKYILHLTVTVDQKKWELSQPFEIGKTEAKEINNQAVNLEKKSPLLLILVIIVIFLFLTSLILIFILWKNRQKKETTIED